MGVQFVLGPAGSGKTEYMLKTIIEESMLHDDMSYLYIVPEQFSMEAQRDIVTRHPRHGSMNIDGLHTECLTSYPSIRGRCLRILGKVCSLSVSLWRTRMICSCMAITWTRWDL